MIVPLYSKIRLFKVIGDSGDKHQLVVATESAKSAEVNIYSLDDNIFATLFGNPINLEVVSIEEFKKKLGEFRTSESNKKIDSAIKYTEKSFESEPE